MENILAVAENDQNDSDDSKYSQKNIFSIRLTDTTAVLHKKEQRSWIMFFLLPKNLFDYT